MDIKGKIEEILSKIKSDKDIQKNLASNPTGTIESLIGVDLPDEQVNAIVEGVKAKVNLDSLSSKLGGLFGKQ